MAYADTFDYNSVTDQQVQAYHLGAIARRANIKADEAAAFKKFGNSSKKVGAFLYQALSDMNPDEFHLANKTKAILARFTENLHNETSTKQGDELVRQLNSLELHTPLHFRISSSGHAMIGIIEKTTDDTGTFTFVNTGPGTERGYKQVTEQHPLFVSSKNIPWSELTQSAFYSSSYTYARSLSGRQKTSSLVDYNFGILDEKGQRIPGSKIGPLHEQQRQEKGTCTISSRLSALRKQILDATGDLLEYKKAKLLFDLAILKKASTRERDRAISSKLS
jgi:hypothetical protein